MLMVCIRSILVSECARRQCQRGPWRSRSSMVSFDVNPRVQLVFSGHEWRVYSRDCRCAPGIGVVNISDVQDDGVQDPIMAYDSGTSSIGSEFASLRQLISQGLGVLRLRRRLDSCSTQQPRCPMKGHRLLESTM
jgi:hypothetical protein